MNSIILAAGEGKRLRPLTENKPKCMIKLFGKSILQWQIDAFTKCGISDISVVTGFKNNVIQIPKLHYYKNENFSTTNMVETLFCAKEKLEGSVIVSYGDIIFEQSILKKLMTSNYPISVVVDMNWRKYWKMRFCEPLSDAESLILDDQNYILDIGQKTQDYDNIQAQYIGLMKFQNEGLDILKKFYNMSKEQAKSGINPLNHNIPFTQSYMTDLLRGIINYGYKVKAIPVNNGWLEIDSIQDYNLYQEKYTHNDISDFFNPN